jgi:hypothetical protein
MSYSIEKLPNEPILLCVMNADYSTAAEAEHFIGGIMKALDNEHEHVYLIMDALAATVSFEDALYGTRLVTQQLQLFKHEKIQESIVVTSRRFLQLVVQGLNNPIFGNIQIQHFESSTEAVAYARNQAAAKR